MQLASISLQFIIFITIVEISRCKPMQYNTTSSSNYERYRRDPERRQDAAGLTSGTELSRYPRRGTQMVQEDPEVVFPASSSVENRRGRELRPPVDSTGQPYCNKTYSYCDHDDMYPTDQVRSIVRSMNVDFSDSGFLGRKQPPSEHFNPELLEEKPVCSVRRKTVYPKIAKNDENDWLYIVNDVDYAQAVTTEICANENTACMYIENSLPFGYRSSCKQKFAYRKLVALHPTQNKAYADNFPLPSCCVCYVKAPPVASSRAVNFNKSGTPQQNQGLHQTRQ